MNNNVARAKKPNAAELAKLLTERRIELYELTAANAVPTVAKLIAEKKSRGSYYIFTFRG
jgi:hypothetical protein